MTKFVIHPPIDDARLQALRAVAPGAIWENAQTAEEARTAAADADAFLGKITPEILQAAPRLRWVQSFTASLEHYMFPDLVAHPCVLTNMRGLFGDVIADQVMGYVICFARNLHTYIRNQTQHRYEPVGGEAGRVNNAAGPGTINAMDRGTILLSGARLGVVGLGGIGSEIARRASAFGIRVRAVDRFPERVAPSAEVEQVAGIADLPQLLTWSDFIVIAAPHTPETERLFDAAMLAHARPSTYLINIGRGAIVVLDDLIDALRADRLAGAALDVFEVEPLPSDNPLWDMANVIITPHTAGYSTAIAARHLDVLRDNVARFTRAEPLRNVVDKALWF